MFNYISQIYHARHTHGPNTWTTTMENFSSYTIFHALTTTSIVQKFTPSIASCLASEIVVNSEKKYNMSVSGAIYLWLFWIQDELIKKFLF